MEIIKEILSSRSGIQLAATVQAMCACFMWEYRRERPWKVVFPLHIVAMALTLAGAVYFRCFA